MPSRIKPQAPKASPNIAKLLVLRPGVPPVKALPVRPSAITRTVGRKK